MSPTHGCHSEHGHVRQDGYMVQDGWYPSGGRYMVWHEDTSTRECQYRKGMPDDPQCKGCECK